MSDKTLLPRVHQMVEALHDDWFGNGRVGYRTIIDRNQERLDRLEEQIEERLDENCTSATRKATLASIVTAVVAAIGTIFTKDKVGG